MKIFKNVFEMINSIKDHYPEVSLRLHLQAVEAINLVPENEFLEE
jgi:hypothetical protein